MRESAGSDARSTSARSLDAGRKSRAKDQQDQPSASDRGDLSQLRPCGKRGNSEVAESVANAIDARGTTGRSPFGRFRKEALVREGMYGAGMTRRPSADCYDASADKGSSGTGLGLINSYATHGATAERSRLQRAGAGSVSACFHTAPRIPVIIP